MIKSCLIVENFIKLIVYIEIKSQIILFEIKTLLIKIIEFSLKTR